jgi:hypothetical protein
MERTTIQAEDKERLLRGRALQITALLENYLIRVLLILKANIGDDEIIKFKEMGLSSRIIMIKDLIKIHYPTLYSSTKKAIKKYEKACKFRNRMAHSLITWHDPTLLTFEVWDIEVDRDGIHNMMPIKYTLHEALEEIEKLKGACVEVIKSTMPIHDEFDRRFPGFFQIK